MQYQSTSKTGTYYFTTVRSSSGKVHLAPLNIDGNTSGRPICGAGQCGIGTKRASQYPAANADEITCKTCARKAEPMKVRNSEIVEPSSPLLAFNKSIVNALAEKSETVSRKAPSENHSLTSAQYDVLQNALSVDFDDPRVRLGDCPVRTIEALEKKYALALDLAAQNWKVTYIGRRMVERKEQAQNRVRMLNTIRTDTFEKHVAYCRFRQDYSGEAALIDLAKSCGVPIRDDEINNLVEMYKESDRAYNEKLSEPEME